MAKNGIATKKNRETTTTITRAEITEQNGIKQRGKGIYALIMTEEIVRSSDIKTLLSEMIKNESKLTKTEKGEEFTVGFNKNGQISFLWPYPAESGQFLRQTVGEVKQINKIVRNDQFSANWIKSDEKKENNE